jgi:hypothetical protein
VTAETTTRQSQGDGGAGSSSFRSAHWGGATTVSSSMCSSTRFVQLTTTRSPGGISAAPYAVAPSHFAVATCLTGEPRNRARGFYPDQGFILGWKLRSAGGVELPQRGGQSSSFPQRAGVPGRVVQIPFPLANAILQSAGRPSPQSGGPSSCRPSQELRCARLGSFAEDASSIRPLPHQDQRSEWTPHHQWTQ